jgi:hypothetical protein
MKQCWKFIAGVARVVALLSAWLCGCAILGFGLGLFLAGCNTAAKLAR